MYRITGFEAEQQDEEETNLLMLRISVLDKEDENQTEVILIKLKIQDDHPLSVVTKSLEGPAAPQASIEEVSEKRGQKQNQDNSIIDLLDSSRLADNSDEIMGDLVDLLGNRTQKNNN